MIISVPNGDVVNAAEAENAISPAEEDSDKGAAGPLIPSERIELVIESHSDDPAAAKDAAAKLISKPGLVRRLSLKPVVEEELPRSGGGRKMSLPGEGLKICRTN